MEQSVYFFSELKAEQLALAGGKGGSLTKLYQSGYPVPDGFVVMPSAFKNDRLILEAQVQAQVALNKIRKDSIGISFAIRSSGLAEDSAKASFAGQFDTMLNVHTDDEVWEAIRAVRLSRHSKEVQAYSEVKGINASQEMAVVVQQMVQADISGVLFTANPVTGNWDEMLGNFVFGLGEELVSGKTTPYTFTLKPATKMGSKDSYDGPSELNPYISELTKLGSQLEKEFGYPQDIEWAIAGNKVYVLQSRPITTLKGHNPATGEWNDSKNGCYLWSNVNFGEAIPEVMTPLTWTVQRNIYESTWKLLPGYQSSGNIGGRIYLNLSIYASVLHSLRMSQKDILRFFEGILYTQIPENMEIPVIQVSKRATISFILNLINNIVKETMALRKVHHFLETNPHWCKSMQEKILACDSKEQLFLMWGNEIFPHLQNTVWYVMGSVAQSGDTMKLRNELTKLVGIDDADTLISGLSTDFDIKEGSNLLASLGPVLGISKLAKGEMSYAEYLAIYGHRGPNEFELSIPRPIEDSEWIDKLSAQFEKSPINVEELLLNKRTECDAAWDRFEKGNRKKAPGIRRRIKKVAQTARNRESIRSEYVRDRWVARTFALRAGQLIGIGENIFFLTLNEMLDILSGKEEALKFIPDRKEADRKYKALPPYPSIICGDFDPFQWAADPNRRNDIYDSRHSTQTSAYAATNDSKRNVIKGSAGSAGRIEGVVRYLKSIEEGKQLEKGEILLTSQTDIAWTPLFPRAAAVITDVGAPLSHAAVIARELGIPAVVGCGNATMYLHTGDRVYVDGGEGVVTILESVTGQE